MAKKKPLTEVDREIIRQFCTVGVSALYDEGMTPNQIVAFMAREEVQEQLALFAKDYNNQDALIALTRFSIVRQLSRMAVDAVDVMQKAIEGPEYETTEDADGNERLVLNLSNGEPRMSEPEVTSKQLLAARDLLDRLGVVKPAKTESQVNVNVDNILSEQRVPVEMLTDPTHVNEEQRALARERVRTVIEQLTKEGAVQSAVKRVKSHVSKPKPAKKKKSKAG